MQVGPVALACELPPGAARRAVSGWLGSYAPPAREAVRLRVPVRVDHAGAEVAGRSARVVFRQPETGADRYLDDSEAWAAELEGFASGAPRARFHVRPAVTGEHLWGNVTRMVLRAVAATAAVRAHALLLHGCALVDPASGGAVLFVGASGQGKTTMARRLPGWTCLADDTVVVDLQPGAPPRVAGSPFPGKEALPRRGEPHRLERILVLEPGAEELAVTPLTAAQSFEALIARTFWYVGDGPLVTLVLDEVQALADRVPVARLASGLGHDLAGRPWAC